MHAVQIKQDNDLDSVLDYHERKEKWSRQHEQEDLRVAVTHEDLVQGIVHRLGLFVHRGATIYKCLDQGILVLKLKRLLLFLLNLAFETGLDRLMITALISLHALNEGAFQVLQRIVVHVIH